MGNYMITLANYFSHLGNYATPQNPNLTTFITGNFDYFYGHEYITPINKVWKGVNTLYLDCGHVDGFIREGKLYRSAIGDVFEKCSSDVKSINYSLFDNLDEVKSQENGGLDFIQQTFQ